MLTTVVVALVLWAVGWTQSQGAAARPFVLTDVTVIDVDRGERLAQRTVVITNGRIEALGPSGTTAIPDGAEVVSGRGQFLMPGLWDMHVHLGGY